MVVSNLVEVRSVSLAHEVLKGVSPSPWTFRLALSEVFNVGSLNIPLCPFPTQARSLDEVWHVDERVSKPKTKMFYIVIVVVEIGPSGKFLVHVDEATHYPNSY